MEVAAQSLDGQVGQSPGAEKEWENCGHLKAISTVWLTQKLLKGTLGYLERASQSL